MSVGMISTQDNFVQIVDRGDFIDIFISTRLSRGPTAVRIKLSELDDLIDGLNEIKKIRPLIPTKKCAGRKRKPDTEIVAGDYDPRKLHPDLTPLPEENKCG